MIDGEFRIIKLLCFIMKNRIDKAVLVSACGLCVATTALLFMLPTANLYFSIGRYLMYLAFGLCLAALWLVWVRAFMIKGWRSYAMAGIKTIVLSVIFSGASIILIVSHSGI